jgi:hypothetical protein
MLETEAAIRDLLEAVRESSGSESELVAALIHLILDAERTIAVAA